MRRSDSVSSWSLGIRMVLVAILTPLSAIALLTAIVLVAPLRIVGGVALALVIGTMIRIHQHRARSRQAGRVLARSDDPELFALLDRLCALAEVPTPELVLRDERQPNSWVVHLPGRPPRLYLTTGLRELLTLDELAAVLAHELSHVAHHDARVMSVVGMPGSIMVNGGRTGNLDGLLVLAIGMIASVGTALLTRYRELAADAGSATITGRPSALASALMKVSDSLERIPASDLRSAAALNAFNLVPIVDRRRSGRWRWIRRIVATHPPLEQRLRALAALELAAQSH